MWPNFGPGVASTFSGADLFNDDNTVWFHPPHEMTAREVHLGFDADAPISATILPAQSTEGEYPGESSTIESIAKARPANAATTAIRRGLALMASHYSRAASRAQLEPRPPRRWAP